LNDYGQLGIGSAAEMIGDEPDEMGAFLPTALLGFGVVAHALTAGSEHTCAIVGDHEVRCWGLNDLGQLGLGHQTSIGTDAGELGAALTSVQLGAGAKAVRIEAGWQHTCVLLASGEVKCWGGNSQGQLGMDSYGHWGIDEAQMGDAFPAIDLGGKAIMMSAGLYHSCAVLEGGSVKCWGYNDEGQLGQEDTVWWGGAQTGAEMANLDVIDLGDGAVAVDIASGWAHNCVVLDDGSVKCWGRNDYGQLGLGAPGTRGDDAGEMGAALSTVDLGTNRTALAVAAGEGHSCALLDDHSVKCWGRNDFGQLGLNDTMSRGLDTSELGDSLDPVFLGTGRTAVAIAADSDHTCALLDDDTLRCWGLNSSGQLGYGDVDSRGDDMDEMQSLGPVPVD
jgi:alpha-tubulin suppressor-like RCC1 family protein